MNKELGLRSIVRPKKPGTKPGKPHKVFENHLKQDFRADRPNQKWCTDFTYLFLKNGETRYNCTIIDLYDRSVIASITDRNITSGLAIRTLQKALAAQHLTKGGVRSGQPVYIQGFHRILRKRPCDPEHEQGRISLRQRADGALLQHTQE